MLDFFKDYIFFLQLINFQGTIGIQLHQLR